MLQDDLLGHVRASLDDGARGSSYQRTLKTPQNIGFSFVRLASGRHSGQKSKFHCFIVLVVGADAELTYVPTQHRLNSNRQKTST
ncbi:hypothetical protein OKW11_000292 [Pseudomonas baetica]|nr:hypothetical protein [Pseudomonas baetica]